MGTQRREASGDGAVFSGSVLPKLLITEEVLVEILKAVHTTEVPPPP